MELPSPRRRRLVAAGLTLAAAVLTARPLPAGAQNLTVFAAASLAEALDAVNAQYRAETGRAVVASYAASSALAQQIEQGAPADVFIAADPAWMDHLAEGGLIREDTRADLLGNRLVLVAPAGSGLGLDIAPGFPLAESLGADGRLAMAEVETVPAGRYGKAALEALSVWPSVENRLAQAENVRVALALVARGEAPLGIVYRTDAAAEPGVEVLGTFPEDTHPPIVYPVAVTAASPHPEAAAYVDYLGSEAARPLFEARGFTVLD